MSDQAPMPRGEQTRKAILDAAEHLFLENGYNGTSMRQIASAVGMAVGGIYNHYGSKEDIFKALVQDRSPYMEMIEVVNGIQGKDGPDMLRTMMVEGRRIMMTHSEFIGLVMIDVREFEGSAIRSVMGTVIPHLMRFAQRVIAAGGVRDDLNLFVLMRTFAMTLLGYIMTDMAVFARGETGVPGLPALGDEFWQNAILDVYLHGIAAPKEEGDASQ